MQRIFIALVTANVTLFIMGYSLIKIRYLYEREQFVSHICDLFVILYQILNEIAQHKIRIYEFPDAEDEEEHKIQKKLKVLV